MSAEKSVPMGIVRIVNYVLITAMVGQFHFYLAENAYLRLFIPVPMHQNILARGEFWRPRIQFLTPIDHTFSNLPIRTTFSPEGFCLKFVFRIQNTAIVLAHLDIQNLKNDIFYNAFSAIDDQSRHKSHIKYTMDTPSFAEMFYAFFDHFGMDKGGMDVFYGYVSQKFLTMFDKDTFTMTE